MPTIVPSIVVKAIESAFPTVTDWQRVQIPAGSSGQIASIIALYDRVPNQHLSMLSDEDYAALTMAVAHARDILERWRYTDEASVRTTGGPQLRAPNAPGGRHPLEVIRTVLAKCPDTAPASTPHELLMLGDPALADVLRRDITSAESALGNGEYKPASVMAGAVIEALLVWALKRKTNAERDAALVAWQSAAHAAGTSSPPKLPTDWEKWKLWHLINAARRIAPIPILSAEAADAANSAREFRNLIHPERADKTPPSRGTAQIAVGAMLRVVEELDALVKSGNL